MHWPVQRDAMTSLKERRGEKYTKSGVAGDVKKESSLSIKPDCCRSFEEILSLSSRLLAQVQAQSWRLLSSHLSDPHLVLILTLISSAALTLIHSSVNKLTVPNWSPSPQTFQACRKPPSFGKSLYFGRFFQSFFAFGLAGLRGGAFLIVETDLVKGVESWPAMAANLRREESERRWESEEDMVTVEWSYWEKKEVMKAKIDRPPLPLLLSLPNGRG